MSNPVEKKRRPFLAMLFSLLGCSFFIAALADTPLLFSSAKAFVLHHEVTTGLAVMLAKFIVGVLFGALALWALRAKDAQTMFRPRDFISLVFLSFLLWGAGSILSNESFFTLYDNKSLPVHPTEIVMHPYGGWMSVSGHLFLCFVGLVAGVVFLRLTKGKTAI
jgi:hypothetical protein